MPLKVFGGSLLLPLRIDGYTFDKVPYTKSIEEKISAQLSDQLPDFIISNYETFVQFIEAYYEWMELEGNPRYEGVMVGNYADIDESLSEFIDYFRSTYVVDFPVNLANGVNEKTIIKYATDLYRAKSTKASFNLLFRILFNTTVSVSYPRDKILRLSTSTFDDNQFIRIEPIFSIDEAFSTINGLVIQRNDFDKTINASAKIDGVEYFQEGGIDFFRLSLVDVSGSFNDQNNVEVTTSGITSSSYSAKLLPTLTGLNIISGGSGYNVNDKVIVRDQNNKLVITAIVKQVGPNGSIVALSYEDSYGVYQESSDLTYTFVTFAGTGAKFTPKSGEVLAQKPDFYKDSTGKISSRSFIQDNFYYQDFSYVLRVNQALEKYASAVRRLIHPSGFVLLNEYLNESNLISGVTLGDIRSIKASQLIGHYLPHTFGTTIDPRGFTYGGTHYDFYPIGYNGQDGRTAGDFYSADLVSGPTGTPHLYPQNGQTHDPYILYSDKTGLTITFDSIETRRTLINGAIGSTGYVGITQDSDGEFVGLFGYFPIGSSRANTPLATYVGVSHYGGYVSPHYTGISGGYSGGQKIQVVGTDSATADYWIVNRHPSHLGITGIGLTGERLRVKIPVLPTTTSIGNNGIYTVGEQVTQDRNGESIAIGEVISFEPSTYSYHSNDNTGTPIFNVGIDYLTVDVLNGVFIASKTIPVVGKTSLISRLIDLSFIQPPVGSNQAQIGNTYDRSWMDVSIEKFLFEVDYTKTDSI